MTGYRHSRKNSENYWNKVHDQLERALERAIRQGDYASQAGIRNKLGHIENALKALRATQAEGETDDESTDGYTG